MVLTGGGGKVGAEAIVRFSGSVFTCSCVSLSVNSCKTHLGLWA